MSFNKKVTVISVLIILGMAAYGALRVYNKLHPKFTPIPAKPELTITIIPGWNLGQVEDYFIKQGLAKGPFLDKIMVPPAIEISLKRSLPADILTDPDNPPLKVLKDKPWFVSYEGYLAPDTYRVFADASITSTLMKLIKERDSQFTEKMYQDTDDFWRRVYNNKIETPLNVHQLLTMASIIEKEVRDGADRVKVADILWRRYLKGWALQVDSSVHYAVDKSGTVFTTDKERSIDSPWNTYKYPGLPTGPICNPGLSSIMSALYPEPNNFWYFMTDKDGQVHYAKTLDEQNYNVNKYLR
ncbi:MAG: endolytic transglycosylase MltG [Patescibacteria group bacterium]